MNEYGEQYSMLDEDEAGDDSTIFEDVDLLGERDDNQLEGASPQTALSCVERLGRGLTASAFPGEGDGLAEEAQEAAANLLGAGVPDVGASMDTMIDLGGVDLDLL